MICLCYLPEIFGHLPVKPLPYLSPYINKSLLLHLPVKCPKTSRWVANSVDLDQMLHFVASDLGLHCLLQACLSIYLGVNRVCFQH